MAVDGDADEVAGDRLGADVADASALGGVVLAGGVAQLGVVVLGDQASGGLWHGLDGHRLVDVVVLADGAARHPRSKFDRITCD